jgi:hypothetical protein
LAVAEDASWNGWVKQTGFERQIPMHPDFRGAKKFVTELDWKLVESSNTLDAPSQAVAQTDLQALRALKVETERNNMALFQKKDQPQNITVQGEEATIPIPPVTDKDQPQDKKVKLPKTVWRSEGASAPLLSNWSWVCENSKCALQDRNGRLVQSFQIEKGIVMGTNYSRIVASDMNPNALRPVSWGCGQSNGTLSCVVSDMAGKILQECNYDGRTLACRN